MGKMPATTKPATQPANMLAKLRSERENIIRAMMTDLARTTSPSESRTPVARRVRGSISISAICAPDG